MTWMEAYWRWRPLLVEALDERYFNGEWLDAQVMSGRAVFIYADDSALVAEMRFYPTGARDVFIYCVAGAASAVRDILGPRLETWGRSNGCLAILGESRSGWTKILKTAGYELYKTAVRKALADG